MGKAQIIVCLVKLGEELGLYPEQFAEACDITYFMCLVFLASGECTGAERKEDQKRSVVVIQGKQ